MAPVSSSTWGVYDAEDIKLFDSEDNWQKWQHVIYDIIIDRKTLEFRLSNNRSILWIEDPDGLAGKNMWVKWFCYRNQDSIMKLTFGTPQQLRNAILGDGSKKVYLIDIPRTRSINNDNIDTIVSFSEELSNGHITAVMYGKFKTGFMSSPHVIFLANEKCPRGLLSIDRWNVYRITKDGDCVFKKFKGR